jgi:3-hydroxyisobutyrate dehydrogenase-like beta-hydroxyacid dehydrogenase
VHVIDTLRFGWLGTGRMGTEMAARLLAVAPKLTVWNRTAAKCAPLVERGAVQAGAIVELAALDAVFVSVTRSEDLVEVVCGPRGLLSGDTVPSVVVDCSTVSVKTSAAVRATLAEHGVGFLAAPISGNPDMVREASGAIAVSGAQHHYEALYDALRAIAPTVAYVGPAEESRLVKICHNLLLGVITQGLAEVTTLAEKAGIANEAFLHFVNGSVLGSPFVRHKGRAIAERDFTPTFTSVNLRKDYDLGLGAARELEVPMPLAASTFQLIQSVIGRGQGDLDYVALYRQQAANAGLDGGAA